MLGLQDLYGRLECLDLRFCGPFLGLQDLYGRLERNDLRQLGFSIQVTVLFHYPHFLLKVVQVGHCLFFLLLCFFKLLLKLGDLLIVLNP